MNVVSFRLTNCLGNCSFVPAGGLQFVKEIFEGLGRQFSWGKMLVLTCVAVVLVACIYRKWLAALIEQAPPPPLMSQDWLPAPLEQPPLHMCQEGGNGLVKDIVVLIFLQLSEKDVARARRTCLRWNRIGKNEHVRNFALGSRVWRQHFGSVGVEPPLPARMTEIMREPCPFWKGKLVCDTHMLVLIPATVKGMAFTLNCMEGLVEAKRSKAKPFMFIWSEVQDQFGGRSPKSSYWMLMTKDVVEGTRNKSYDEQCRLVTELGKTASGKYEAPTLMEATTSTWMSFFERKKPLYTDCPDTLTRCQERIVGQCLVGSLHVKSDSFTSLFFSNGNYYDGNETGLAAVRRFLV